MVSTQYYQDVKALPEPDLVGAFYKSTFLGGSAPCLVTRKRKIALKMYENVSNFKKFSPAVPIGTAAWQETPTP